jgi:hypothetical protein
MSYLDYEKIGEPRDKKTKGWSLAEWWDGVKQGWTSGPKTIVAPKTVTPTAKVSGLAAAARSRTGDAEVTTRRRLARDKMAVWRNDIAVLLERVLKENFHPENYARMALMKSRWSNPLRRIVCDTAIVYQDPAKRYLLDEVADPAPTEPPPDPAPAEDPAPPPPAPGAPPVPPKPAQPAQPAETPDALVARLSDELGLEGAHDDAEKTDFEKAMDLADLDTAMDHAEKLASFQPAVWIRPVVRYEELDGEGRGDAAKGRLVYVVYTPATADVIPDPDDPGRALAWWYDCEEIDLDTGARRPVRHFFTKDEYTKYDSEWRALDTKPNKLGRLPVVKLQLDETEDGRYFLDGQGDDLFYATMEVNGLRTMQNARFRDGSFKQMVITGADPDDVATDQIMGGPSPIVTPEGSTAQALDFSPDLLPMNATIRERLIELAAGHGISAQDWTAETVPESGYAKRLSRDRILRESRRRRKFLKRCEQELYALLARVLKESPVGDVGDLKEDADLEVDFAEPRDDEQPKQQAETDALDVKLGKISVVDVLKRDNPDLSEAELVALAHKNLRITEELSPAGGADVIDRLLDAGLGAQQQDGGGGSGGFGGGGGSGAPKKPGAPPFGGGK